MESSKLPCANFYLDRPMALTIWNTKDSVFEGLRFLQAQMWYVLAPKFGDKVNFPG
jgi:hypothetical protein